MCTLLAGGGLLLFARLNEHAFQCSPQIQLIRIRIGADLELSVYGPTERVARHMQILAGGLVLEANGLVASPELVVALHDPVVAVVALAEIAERAHLLVIGQRRLEQVTVQVVLGGQMSEADHVVATHGSPRELVD